MLTAIIGLHSPTFITQNTTVNITAGNALLSHNNKSGKNSPQMFLIDVSSCCTDQCNSQEKNSKILILTYNPEKWCIIFKIDPTKK